MHSSGTARLTIRGHPGHDDGDGGGLSQQQQQQQQQPVASSEWVTSLNCTSTPDRRHYILPPVLFTTAIRAAHATTPFI